MSEYRAFLSMSSTAQVMRVEVAGNVSAAVEKARADRFDLLMAELEMPMIGGIEQLQMLSEEQPGLKMVASSGEPGGTFPKAAEALGIRTRLLKPVSPEQLVSAVKSELL